ncbi:MAG: exo-alpha-sialidase [Clostridia bacterium]|nr:exo-alpha-sialidase [Clostridia bacterium]
MRGKNTLDWRPYLPFNRAAELNNPFVCRLAPDANGFTFEWFDRVGGNMPHTLVWGERDGVMRRQPIADRVVRVDGLEEGREYEFRVEASDGRVSSRRLLRTCAIPEGTSVINYLHPEDGQYDFSGRFLCSPSLARTKSGRLVAGMDLFGHRMAQNLTLLFASDDDGANWRYLCDLYPFYWGSLFTWRGKLYILGLSTEYGNLQIACSGDEGESWSEPVTLFCGSSVLCNYGGMHRAPMHLVEEGGRLWTTCEYGSWGAGSHIPAVISMPVDADPMRPESWVMSELLHFDGEWREASGGVQGDTMEGNILRAPDGKLYNYLRWKTGQILRLRIDEENPEAPLVFAGFAEAPVSMSMFRMIPHGGRWVMVANSAVPAGCNRNLLALFESGDLEHFTQTRALIDYSGFDPAKHGFQYPAYLLEGDTLTLSVRSVFNNANNHHDSNYMLFLRTQI